MSSILIAGDTSGTITLDAPNVAGTTVLTLPTANGTVLTTANTFAAGTGPAFSAYANATTTVASATFAKVNINAESYDTNNNFNTANSRFTPTVAGYYQINGNYLISGAATGIVVPFIFKNGNIEWVGAQSLCNPSQSSSATSALVYCNGSTDYIELYAYQTSGSTLTVQTNSGYTGLSGFLARSA